MLLFHLHLWRILLIMHIISLTLKILFYFILFYYRCCFSPVKSTWKQTVHKGFFISWPGLTCAAINKYLDKSLASSKGHLHQTQQGSRSTKDVLTSEADAHPRLQRKIKEVFIKIKPLGTVYSDQTGTFPYLSSRGFRYIMIMYDYDMNAILLYLYDQNLDPSSLVLLQDFMINFMIKDKTLFCTFLTMKLHFVLRPTSTLKG